MTNSTRKVLIYVAMAIVLLLPQFLPTQWQPGTGAGTAYAQETGKADAEPAVASSAPDVTVMDMIKVGGLIMIPIFLCSVWMLALLAELILKLRQPVVSPPESMQAMKEHVGDGDFTAAWQHSIQTPSILCTVVQRAFRKLPRGQDAVETEAAEALMDVNNTYKTKISYLGVIAGVAPMLGLRGTVPGMIKAFNKMGHEGAIGDPAKLAGDIGEALVTTFSGLTVAIPAMIIFYVMTNRLKKILTFVQEEFTGLMEDVDYTEVPADLVFEADEKAAGRTVAVPAQIVPCPSCNGKVKVGSKTCGSCGQELQWD